MYGPETDYDTESLGTQLISAEGEDGEDGEGEGEDGADEDGAD
jgi:hypothetical protein